VNILTEDNQRLDLENPVTYRSKAHLRKVNILTENNQRLDLENPVTYKSKAHWLQDSWSLHQCLY